MTKYEYFGTKHPHEFKACLECGVESWIQKRRQFCSLRCSRLGGNNPAWKGDAAKPTSARQRAHRIDIDRSICERCGVEGVHHRHHKDENTYNNSLDNLEILCAQCHGKEHMTGQTRSQGEKHGKAKLTEKDVLRIRERYVNGEGPAAIAEDYPVTPSVVSNIVARRNWKHI